MRVVAILPRAEKIPGYVVVSSLNPSGGWAMTLAHHSEQAPRVGKTDVTGTKRGRPVGRPRLVLAAGQGGVVAPRG